MDLRTAASFLILVVISLLACKHTGKKHQGDLSQIKIGMSYTEVLNRVGFPDEKVDLGSVYDEYSNQTHTEEWHYGENQLIVIVNDTVNAIDLDMKKTYDRIQHIIDSARADGDTAAMIQLQQ